MPTKYLRKPGVKPRVKLWDDNVMEEAKQQVLKGKMTLREAEKSYGVPRRSLSRYLKNPAEENCNTGPCCKSHFFNIKSIINKGNEKIKVIPIYNWLTHLNRYTRKRT